ncbi:Ig-like domain repeat protein [Clostridiaceae bacterium 35-E11]
MDNYITSVEVSKKGEGNGRGHHKAVNVGDIIEIKAHITDDKSGVKSAYVGIRTPSGLRTIFVHLHVDAEANFWVGSYTIQATDEGGEYKDFFIHLEDNAGNIVNSWELLDSFEEKMKFNVNNPNGDSLAPKILDIETTTKKVNVGESVTIKASFTDDKSGVKSAYIGIKNPSGSRTLFVHLNKDTEINQWTGKYTVLPNDEGGVYNQFFVHIDDNAGNTINSWESLNLYKEKMEFTITNNDGDIKAPVVTDIEITPKEVNVNDTLTIRANISDDKSGVKSAYVGIKSPSGNKTLFIHLHLDEKNNIWVGSYTIKQSDQCGVYKDMFIHLEDNARNPINSWNLLDKFKGSLTFMVNNNYHSDIEPPEIKQIMIKDSK